MSRVFPPKANPCGSCPYRRDVPSGVWDEEEYAKLPRYDQATYAQPSGAFMCHQQDASLCTGWVGCHDMNESMGLRMLVITGRMEGTDAATVLDFTTSVPLFSTGAEAAAHGRAELYTPDDKARRVIAKLRKKGVAE